MRNKIKIIVSILIAVGVIELFIGIKLANDISNRKTLKETYTSIPKQNEKDTNKENGTTTKVYNEEERDTLKEETENNSSKIEVIETTADDLLNLFVANAAKGNIKFKDKRVKLTGTFSEILKVRLRVNGSLFDLEDKYQIFITPRTEVSRQYILISCKMNFEEELSELIIGNEITLIADYVSYDNSTHHLELIEIVKSTSN